MESASPVAAAGDPWLRDLFPATVLIATSPPRACEAELFSEERALIERAVESRRREFATARVCARKLLAELGVEGFALLRGADRAPLWPTGVIGSISHCRDLCVAAVARRGALRSLGVDVEPAEPLEPALWRRILTPREATWLGSRETERRGRIVRLFFSAKEAVYKCVRAAGAPELGFHDVELDLALEEGRFAARWSSGRTGEEGSLHGRFAFRGRWVLTSALSE